MSTGMNCNFYERKPGEWYYLLEDYGSPKGAWDWREYATAYGPFETEDEAFEHLADNHANPGGSYTVRHGEYREDEVLAKAFASAPENRDRRGRTGWGGAGGSFYFPGPWGKSDD